MKKRLLTALEHLTSRFSALGCTALLLLCCSMATSEVAAQNVTLKFENTRLEQIMADITKQTAMSFAYSREVIDINKTFSINVENAPVLSALATLFANEQYSYKIVDKKIYLSATADQSSQGTMINTTITGRITDEHNAPIIGATIVLKGRAQGTTSGLDGSYKLKVSGVNPILEVAFIGYKTEQIKLSTSRQVVNVKMEQLATQIDEVVVTALGLTRTEKSLGYAVTKVNNESLNNSVSNNWLNGMAGKVAGLNFDSAGAGPGGSIRVTLRGESSLSYDNNTALFVIDGVPISSGMTPSSSGGTMSTDAPIDYGNGASDLNPEDIENVSVLKGPAATALYGSRAANGAIVITTKSGRQTKGIGVTVNSSVTFEQAGFWPEFQTEYGAGNGNNSNLIQQQKYNYWNVPAAFAEDGIASGGRIYSRVAFGAKFNGQQFYQYESRNWESGMYKKMPWVYRDWYKGFFETGATYNNSVSVDCNNGKGVSARISVRDTRNDWIVPNTGYTSQNINLSLSAKVNKSITMQGKVTYYRKNSDNLPMSGYNAASPLYTLIWNPNVVDVSSYYREYKNGRIDQMYEQNTSSLLINSTYADNLYMQVYEQLNTMSRDRVYGNLGLNIILAKNLTLDIHSGMDFSNDFRTQRKPWYSNGYIKGYYREQTVRTIEINNDFLFSYAKKFGNFDLKASFGGNNMSWQNQDVSGKAKDGLQEKGIYKICNSISPTVYTSYRYAKSINSFFGFVSSSWKDTYFLDITARNDWSSTLAPGNNSYFYPSVSASVLLDQAFNLRDSNPWIDMIKVRASWANVGNDTSPNQLLATYSNSAFSSSYHLNGTMQNYNIKPENVRSWEYGIDTKFFGNRLGIDIAYYDSQTTNQIIPVPMDQAIGATSAIINAGCVSNKGIEVSAHFQPIKTKDFKWTIDMNWSKNWNKLVELADGVTMWQMNSSMNVSGNIYINAYPGTELGRLYGRGFKRAPKGSFFYDSSGNKIDCSNEVIVDQATGAPVLTSPDEQMLDLGSIYPDWTAGMSHSLAYKNFKLGFTFSAQWGGNTYSSTHFALAYQGKLTNSLEGRYAGLIHPGVNLNEDGTFTKNNTITADINDYYTTYVWARENAENNTFDTSFLKLKEMRLDYTLPRSICEKLKFIQGATIGVYATNLFCWTNYPFYDPEAGFTVGSSIKRGIEAGAYPMTRTYGLNIKLNF